MKKLFTSLLLLPFMATLMIGQTYFSENFDSSPDIPSGWAVFDNGVGTQKSWKIYNYGESGNRIAAVTYEQVAAGSFAEDYFATPEIDLTSATNPRLVFKAGQSYGPNYGSTYSVMVSTTTQTDISAYTVVQTWSEEELGGVGLPLSVKMVDLSAYKGKKVYVVFMMKNNNGDNFLIDDVSVEESVNNSATLLSLGLTKYMIANQDNTLKMTIRNHGANPINSLEVNWNDGTDHISTISTTLSSGEEKEISHPTPINYAEAGIQKNIKVTVTKINGVADVLPDDNSLTQTVNTISKDGGKKVLFEEGTGTWCGWCPRGTVALKNMHQNYPDKFIGIAVHGGGSDPMINSTYINSTGISGFPGMNVDRIVKGAGVSENAMKTQLAEFSMPTPVELSGTSTISGRDVSINVSSKFYSNFTNVDFKLGLIVVENGVTGTTANYNQANYYAGGGNGPMGGYENLPNPVPASQMVYNNVGRELLGGYNGQANSVPATLTDGQEVTYTFNYTVPAAYDIDKLYGVVVLIDSNDGRIVNANTVKIGNMSVKDINLVSKGFVIYPNPAKDVVNLSIEEAGEFTATIYNMLGQVVYTQDLGSLDSKANVTLPISKLRTGNYLVTISGEGKSYSKRLMVK